ncbi:WD40-repeat-containing domain protein [Dipodascopsis tothii]|uniref:WD40-repeat-containing domain protein n=1 Tax=Dipodascopsis tothii TaxID=44089 RepID=UPI0034CFCA38
MDDDLADMFPKGFGKQAVQVDKAAIYRRLQRADWAQRVAGLAAKASAGPATGSDDSDLSDDSSDDEMTELPISHEIFLKNHTKTVSALSIDPQGTRMATGSFDYDMNLYDFSGMDMRALTPFRTVEPVEAHHIHELGFSHNGEHVLVIPASSQAKLYTRDGEEVAEYVRGDMYLRDMNNTDGHVAEITSGVWHPTDKNVFVTGSLDSTVRVWDANVRRKQRTVIVVKSKASKGNKTRVTAVNWAPDGKRVAGACTDGSLSFWSTTGPHSRPTQTLATAHAAEDWVSSIQFVDDNTFLTRTTGDAGVLKLWDARNFKTPILQRGGLASAVQQANFALSPDRRHIVLGTSGSPQQAGQLHVLDKSDLSTVAALDFPLPQTAAGTTVGPAAMSVVKVVWHAELNQIAAGLSTGSVHLLFSDRLSKGGAMVVAEKAPKKRHIDDEITADIDLDAAAAAAERMMGGTGSGSGENYSQLTAAQRAARERKDPIKSHKPQMPHEGMRSMPARDHVDKNIALSGMRNEDPREALLKYAKIAEEDPMFFKVYEKTQPKKILAEIEDEPEEAEEREAKRRR